MKKTMGEFTLEIKEGEFTDSEIVVMLGENGEFVSRVADLNGVSSRRVDVSQRPCVRRHGENHIHQDVGRIPQARRRRSEFITHV